jgi:hypothetical protein
MGYLRAALLASAIPSLAACGGDGGTADALIIVPDAAPDARPIDAPPDAPSYDFACVGMPLPTTAPATIVANGTTQEISLQSGIVAVGDATVSTFKVGTATAVDTVTSAANGSFTTGNLATGGVPFDGYIQGFKDGGLDAFRNTFVFPPAPLAADAPLVPILMLRASLFRGIGMAAGVTQDDDQNGALMLFVTDCANMPMVGTTVSAKQGGNSVGTIVDVSMITPMAAGIYVVFNVPPGNTDVSASYMGMNFPAHRVISFKNGTGITTGATTLTIVRPGPL